MWPGQLLFNSLRPGQNGRHFPDDIFKWIFLNENKLISINISLKFVRKGLINNIPALVLIMALRRPGDKPLSEPMLVISLTHICVTRPQWVNGRQHQFCSHVAHQAKFIFKKLSSPAPSTVKIMNTNLDMCFTKFLCCLWIWLYWSDGIVQNGWPRSGEILLPCVGQSIGPCKMK